MSPPWPPPGTTSRPPEASFWQSVSGVITAVAALITALVAVAAFVFQVAQSRTGGPADPADPAAAGRTGRATGVASQTVPHTSDGSGGAALSGAPAPSTGDPKGSGPYEVLFNNNGVDLDADPPRVATGPDTQIDVYESSVFSPQLSSFPIWAGLAKWTSTATPTRRGCLALLNGFATVDSAFAKGSRFCVHTRGEQHVALIEVVEPMSHGWRLRVTVWPGMAV